MSLQRKLNVKIFLMFIVAENTGSVNIVLSIPRSPNVGLCERQLSMLISCAVCHGISLTRLRPLYSFLYADVDKSVWV